MTESDILHLFHTGYAEIREPDIHYGRKNADFGQGFYLSDSDEFAGKWMRERKDVVIGPISNDTIYDTLGILTSGVLTQKQSLQLLRISPVFEQTVVKTEKAAHWSAMALVSFPTRPRSGASNTFGSWQRLPNRDGAAPWPLLSRWRASPRSVRTRKRTPPSAMRWQQLQPPVSGCCTAGACVISVDINSGMNGDTGEAELAVRSDLTVTIGFVKNGMLAANAGSYMKRLVVADIGIILDREENKIADPWREEYTVTGNILRRPAYLDMNPIDTRDIDYSGDNT